MRRFILIISLLIISHNFCFSQSLGFELDYGLSNSILYNSKNNDYIDDGHTHSISVYANKQINGNIFEVEAFFRSSENKVKTDWFDYPYEPLMSDDLSIFIKIYGLGLKYGKNIILGNDFYVSPLVGLNIGIVNQYAINKNYTDEYIQIYIGDTFLREYKTKINLIDNLYLSSSISFRFTKKIRNFNLYIFPELEYHLNPLFTGNIAEDNFIFFNTGVGLSYNFSKNP